LNSPNTALSRLLLVGCMAVSQLLHCAHTS
jgi:hypothetical protein